jgi:hypothetical protein
MIIITSSLWITLFTDSVVAPNLVISIWIFSKARGVRMELGRYGAFVGWGVVEIFFVEESVLFPRNQNRKKERRIIIKNNMMTTASAEYHQTGGPIGFAKPMLGSSIGDGENTLLSFFGI